MDENALSFEIIGAAIDVHDVLGPGLLASASEMAFRRELRLRGLEAANKAMIEIKSSKRGHPFPFPA